MLKRTRRSTQYKRIFFLTLIVIGVILVSLLLKGFVQNAGSRFFSRSENQISINKNVSNTQKLDSSYVVAIDAGHGGNDPGTSGFGLLEKDVTLDIAQKLNNLLKSSGINTLMIRNGDDYMDRIDRIQYANSKNPTLYLSIHCDWFEDKSFTGIRTFYNPDGKLSAGGLSETDYANNIEDNLINLLNANKMGLVPDNELSVLKRAEMPSVLVEMGFLSNMHDAGLLKTEDYREKAAEALSNGIIQSLKGIK